MFLIYQCLHIKSIDLISIYLFKFLDICYYINILHIVISLIYNQFVLLPIYTYILDVIWIILLSLCKTQNTPYQLKFKRDLASQFLEDIHSDSSCRLFNYVIYHVF